MLRLLVLCLVAACGRIAFDERAVVADDAPPTCGPATNYETDAKNCGTCGHDCLGGECNAGTCGSVVLAAEQGPVRQILVDDTHIYYTSPGVVRRISKTTRAVEDVATYSGTGFRMAQTLDYVYFVTRDSGLVARALKKPNQGAAEVIATNQGDVGGIASDDVTVFWDNYPTGGRVSSKLITASIPVQLTGPLDDLTGIRLVGNTLYFLRDQVGLFAMPKTGGTPVRIGPTQGSWEMAIDGDDVFLARFDRLAIMRMSLTTGMAVEVTASDGPWGIEVDETHVYFANEPGGTIARAPRSGGPPEILAEAELPVGIAVDDKAVYWTTIGGVIGMRAK